MYIGSKEVKEAKETEDKTPGGTSDILRVQFTDGSVEYFSRILYENITSEEMCDATQLREKRVLPIVGVLLAVLREWGIKVGDLPYMSALLNQSLDENQKEASKELWSKWMPKPLDLDDVDLLTIDRVLKSAKKTVNDVLNGEPQK